MQRIAASDTTAMRKALVQTMGWDVGPPEATIADSEREYRGGEVIWRKHLIVLLQHAAFQALVLIAAIYLLIAGIIGMFPFSDPVGGITIIILIVGMVFALIWFSYGYDAWNKDIYIVTDKMIIDIDGSPFGIGPEKRREGTFGVVQNITYVSPSFFSRLINMGDVVIETAGTMDTFTFEQVHDYKGVQREVSRRLFAFKERVRQQKRTEDEKRFTQWLGEYHTMSGEVGEIAPKGQPQP